MFSESFETLNRAFLFRQLWLVTQDVSGLQSAATEEEGAEHLSRNQQLKSRAAQASRRHLTHTLSALCVCVIQRLCLLCLVQLDAELEAVTQQLSDALDQKLHHQLTAVCHGNTNTLFHSVCCFRFCCKLLVTMTTAVLFYL